MGILKFLFDVNPDDSTVDKVLKIGGSADWITPSLDLIRGFNTVEYEGWYEDCKQKEKDLKKQGIKCRTQFIGDSWRVISKR